MDERMALYVTARVGPRGPVLASIRIPQVSLLVRSCIYKGHY